MDLDHSNQCKEEYFNVVHNWFLNMGFEALLVVLDMEFRNLVQRICHDFNLMCYIRALLRFLVILSACCKS